MFKKFAMDYFRHMWRNHFEQKPALLAKIYGMYEIKMNHKVNYLIVQENLFFGIPKSPDRKVYDLKGSETNRLKTTGEVLLDTNFIIDRNAEPLPVIRDSFRYMDRAF